MQIETIDNFLEDKTFEELQQSFFEKDFPWYYNNYVNFDNAVDENFQFIHLFYKDDEPKSRLLYMLHPILDKLDIFTILRIKANLITNTSKIKKHGFHIDIPLPDGIVTQTAILYLNTNNGYTYFEDGTRIESVQNRLVIFPGGLQHGGTTCTDKKVRALVNFNYIGK